MVFVLRDSVTLDLDAILITDTTEKEELQNIIDDVKENNEDWTFEDIEKKLPMDVGIYTSWLNDFETLWY